MEFVNSVKNTACQARDALTSKWRGGNQDNPGPEDMMDVDPPNDRQGDWQYFGGQQGGSYQPHPQQYGQGPHGAGGQRGYHGGNSTAGYQRQQRQGGYSSGHRTNAAFHEQRGGAYDTRYSNSREQEQLRAMQMREQRHRSLQASKQMVYDVYSQTIGMLEEFEDFDDPEKEGISEQEGPPTSRETLDQNPDVMDQWQGADHPHGHGGHQKHKETSSKSGKQEKEQKTRGKGKKKRDLGRSDVQMQDQSQKTKRDVKAIVEAELVCLQAQLRFCPPEIREQTRQELVDKTLGWVAARQEKWLKKGLADVYASQVVEILVTGETKLQVPTQRKESAGPAGEEAVLSGVQALQRGHHYGAEQDKKFHEDPNKKAQCPRIRSGPVPEVHGAQRVLEVNPGLREHFQESSLL